MLLVALVVRSMLLSALNTCSKDTTLLTTHVLECTTYHCIKESIGSCFNDFIAKVTNRDVSCHLIKDRSKFVYRAKANRPQLIKTAMLLTLLLLGPTESHGAVISYKDIKTYTTETLKHLIEHDDVIADLEKEQNALWDKLGLNCQCVWYDNCGLETYCDNLNKQYTRLKTITNRTVWGLFWMTIVKYASIYTILLYLCTYGRIHQLGIL